MLENNPFARRSPVDIYKNPEEMAEDKEVFPAGTQTNIPSIAIDDFRPELNPSPTFLG